MSEGVVLLRQQIAMLEQLAARVAERDEPEDKHLLQAVRALIDEKQTQLRDE
jgi:hypothetical protein